MILTNFYFKCYVFQALMDFHIYVKISRFTHLALFGNQQMQIVPIFFLDIDELRINCKNCEHRNAQCVCFNFSSKETVLVKGLLGTKQPFYALINSIRHTG